MKKPLLDDSDIFFSHFGGQIAAWDMRDKEILVEAANQGLRNDIDETTLIVPERLIFEDYVAQCLTRLMNDGVTEELVDELNEETAELRYRRVLDIYDDGRPRWTNIADLDELEPESKAAYAISHLIGSGAFERLRQCQDDACDQFFLGPPNALWCSKRCGSRARGRAKRKRDRDAGVLPGT